MNYKDPLLMTNIMKQRFAIMSADLGFIPRCVLDIGAFEGYWSKGIKEVFPNCNPFMIEGDVNKTELLNSVGFPFEIALLSDKKKTATFHKTTSLYTTGNSMYKENSVWFSDNNHYTEQIQTRTLEEIVQNREIKDIDLIKIDVQGAEKDVILGGVDVVRSCKVVVLELSIIEYNCGAPQFAEMIIFMDQLGFKLYDIIELHYGTGKNKTLEQLDAIFIHK